MTPRIILHRDFTVAPVDPRIFGIHFTAADRAAIADPDHPASEDGVRADLIDMIRAWRLPCAIGSAAPVPADGAGDRAILVDGLVDWCRRAEAEPMLSLDPDEARGVSVGERHGVTMWHVGIGGTENDAADRLLTRLRSARPSSTIVLGAARAGLDPDHTVDLFQRHRRSLDLVSLPAPGCGVDPRLPSSLRIARALDETVRRLDRAATLDRSGCPVGLQIDLWGAPADDNDPAAAAIDRALVMNLLMRRADRVRTAFAGGVVAGLADMMSPALGMGHRPILFDPVLAGSVHGRGTALMPVYRGPDVELADGDAAPAVDAAAIDGEDGRSLTLFLVNRSDEARPTAVQLHGYAGFGLSEFRLATTGPRLPGTPMPAPVLDGLELRWSLPALSYGLVRLTVRPR